FPAERERGTAPRRGRGGEGGGPGAELAARPFHHPLFVSLGRCSPFPTSGKGSYPPRPARLRAYMAASASATMASGSRSWPISRTPQETWIGADQSPT